MNQPLFDGVTYDPKQDQARLTGQLKKVHEAMSGEKYLPSLQIWWTLSALARYVDGSEAGVSARVRDLRKKKFGSHTVETRRVKGGNGLWEYKLIV